MGKNNLDRHFNIDFSNDSRPTGEFDEINDLLRSVPLNSIPCDLDHVSSVVRKHPTHGVHVLPDTTTIVCVTVCCEDRIPWLANDRHHEILLDIWRDSSHWIVGQYVLMPDHLHLFATPRESAVEFDAWVRYFKSQFTKRNKQSYCEWQTDHWDTRIRNAEHYEEKWMYMYNNPVRAGLVNDARDWKYKGAVYPVCWE